MTDRRSEGHEKLLGEENLPAEKKSENTKITPLKSLKKISKSPNLPKKNNQDNAGSGAKPKSVTSLQPDDVQQYLSHSAEELDTLEGASSGKHSVAPLVPTIQQENGSCTTTTSTTTSTTTTSSSNTLSITTNTATSTTTTSSGGLGSSDNFLDESDGAHTPDQSRTRAAIEHLQAKIHKIMGQIKIEQNSKEANVNEYLRLASGADKQQILRIKTVFEKKNQKSTHSIAQLQRKLENYQRKLNDVETYGVSSHKQAKEVLRDMGQGLKDVGANIMDGLSGFSGKQPRTHGFSPRGVVDNIKGAKETLVSKPREFAHLIKNRFGSADNISQLELNSVGSSNASSPQPRTKQPIRFLGFLKRSNTTQEFRPSVAEMLVPVPQRLPRKVSGPKAHTYGLCSSSAYHCRSHPSIVCKADIWDFFRLCSPDSMEENPTDDTSHHGSGTLPASFKYGSEDDNSSITSGSGFGAQSSPHSASQNMAQQQQQHQGLPATCMQVPSLGSQHSTFNIDYRFMEQREILEKLQDKIHRLADEFEVYKVENSYHGELNVLRSMLEEERYRSERLEEQLNDLTELHQNEITNMKQEMSSMEEKLDYQLEERTRDMHDLLDNCQTRISKMEVQQQQQQQLISMEMVENVTFRTLLTKLINVVLAILAVVLVFVSTAANLVAPFLTTRARILSTFLLIFVIVVSWRNWDRFLHFFDYFVAEYNRLLSKR